ncbi:hypothetical protein B0H14DRAFT_2561502 [Mycena olivaceomarginata]|nr:hypothetical protein B0H14DRAFT_2561502 [Mycena olivaceomarginata]
MRKGRSLQGPNVRMQAWIQDVLNKVPEPFFGTEITLRKWCKIKTVIRKAAAARIPASFLLTGAYDLQGNDNNGRLTSQRDRSQMNRPTPAHCARFRIVTRWMWTQGKKQMLWDRNNRRDHRAQGVEEKASG